MNDVQHIILKKLKTYKKPKTARELFDVLAPKHSEITSVQKMNNNLFRLWEQGHVDASDKLPREYSARSR